MSYIFYDDKTIQDGVTVVHTVDSGTLTPDTDIKNIINRSPSKSYDFTTTGIGQQHTIEFTFPDSLSTSSGLCVAIISAYRVIVNLRAEIIKPDGSVADTLSTPNSYSSKNIGGEVFRKFVFRSDSPYTYKKIRIKFQTGANNYSIGKVFIGDAVKVDIQPKSLRYSFDSIGSKLRSDGGAISGEINTVYLKASFTTTATPESKVIRQYFDINYKSSDVGSVLFVPSDGETIIVYGPQSSLNSSSIPNLARDSSSDWLYETSFSIEEEL